MFADRFEAGEKLVPLLQKYKGSAVVLAIPRGGVLTAFPIAKALKTKVSLIIVRKLGVPDSEEQGFGAVDGDGRTTLNNELVYLFGITEDQINRIAERERNVIEERIRIYNAKMPELEDKIVIIVDDGLATGYTMLSAINFVKRRNPRKIIAAVPTAHSMAHDMIKKAVDEICCLDVVGADMYAVGLFYEDFHEVGHEEIKRILAEM